MTLEEFLEALRLYFGLPVVETVDVADSYDELMREVRDALMQWTGRPAQEMSVYYTFSDRVVAYQWVERGPNRVWEIPWSRNEAGQIIFGTAVEVRKVITYVPVSESQGKEERFTEQVEQQLLTVESTAADGPRRVKAIGITADVVNGNRRRYPRAVLGAALADLNSHLHESAGQGRMILTGEAEHPGAKGGRTNILETVVKWEAAALNAAGQVILEGIILPTAKGKDVQVLIENGVPIGVSQRAYGVSKSVQESGGVVEELVKLRITGYDLVAEPSDPNGRITESREKPVEEKRAMTLEELMKLLDEKPEMAEALMKRMGLADKKALAESMGVEPAKLEEGLKAAKAAQDELAERKRQESIGQAITEATKELKYGERVNALFVEAVKAAKPGQAEDVKSIVEAKRKEYDGMMAAAKLGSMGHRPQGSVIDRVSTGFEDATGLPEYAKPATVLTEAMVERRYTRGHDWLKPTTANELFAKRYLEAYDKAYRSQLEEEARRYQLMVEAEATSDLSLPYSVQRAIIAEAVPELVALSVFDFGLADSSPTRVYFEAYAGESGSSATITDETYTADHDTWVDLAHKRVRPGTLVVELGGTATVKAEYTDYVVDYANGRVMILSTGTISDSADLDVTYTYDSVREGEGSAIQRGKGTLSFQTIELMADRLAAEINDEAMVFASTQLGWDAQTRTVGMLIREIREMIDSGTMRLGIAQAHIAANSGGTWTSATDPLSELVEKIGVAKVAVQNDYYMPTAVLMSVTNADRLSNWDGYTAAGERSTARQDGGMLGAGDTGLSVKGLPVFASTEMPDTKILVCHRELVQYRVLSSKPMHLEGPFPSYSSNKLIASKQWYIEEYNQTVSLIAAKGGYVTVA